MARSPLPSFSPLILRVLYVVIVKFAKPTSKFDSKFRKEEFYALILQIKRQVKLFWQISAQAQFVVANN